MLRVFRKLRVRNNSGDTYVEVLISIVVLALVLTAAYVLATHSLSSSVDNQKRTKALSVGQGQISQLVNAQGALTAGLDKYTNPTTTGPDFCINKDGSTTKATNDGDHGVKLCDAVDGYSTGIKYDTATGIFTITVQWARSGSKTINQVQVFYKNPAKTAGLLDVCPNINGIQTELPAGAIKDPTTGKCIIDVCPNIDGVQEVVPDGFHLTKKGECKKGNGNPSGTCKCDDGSDCPNGDGSQCPGGYKCTCSDGTDCPNDNSSNCVPGDNGGDDGCDNQTGFRGGGLSNQFGSIFGVPFHFGLTGPIDGGGDCDSYDCGGTGNNAGNCDDPDCTDPAHADDPYCTGEGDPQDPPPPDEELPPPDPEPECQPPGQVCD